MYGSFIGSNPKPPSSSSVDCLFRRSALFHTDIAGVCDETWTRLLNVASTYSNWKSGDENIINKSIVIT